MTKKMLIKVSVLYGMFGLILIGALYMVSPLNHISAIKVTGNHYADREYVIEQSGIQLGDNRLGRYWYRDRLERKIVADIPEVKSAKISLLALDEVEIEVSEYNVIANLKTDDNQYTAVLDNGALFHSDQAPYTDKPILVNITDEKMLTQLIESLRQVDSEVLSMISDIELMTSDHNPMLIKLFMNDGNQVLASVVSLAERINLYPKLVAGIEPGQTGLFDLEVGAHFVPRAYMDEADALEKVDELNSFEETAPPQKQLIEGEEALESENVTE